MRLGAPRAVRAAAPGMGREGSQQRATLDPFGNEKDSQGDHGDTGVELLHFAGESLARQIVLLLVILNHLLVYVLRVG